MKRKKRNTHAKRIQSQSDTDIALEVAVYNRALSPIERTLRAYYTISAKQKPVALRACLGNAMLQAVDSRDAKFFLSIADSIEMLGKQPYGVGSQIPNIIAMKGVLDDNKLSMTVKRLAETLGVLNTPDTGKNFKTLQALRLVCKKYRFPIKEGRRGRPTKNETRKLR